MALILAGPRSVPAPPVGPQWPGVTTMTWTVPEVGAIDLLDPSEHGVMVLRDGIRGLNMPPVERFASSSPAVAGARWRGFQTRERPVFWPTLVHTREGAEVWHAYDSGLWATLRPDLIGEWQVVTDRTGARRLPCRWVGDGDHSFQRDPLECGWAVYGIELVAEDPYWRGEHITATWGDAGKNSPPLLPGPPFYIGSSATVDTAVLENPGDLPAHVVWTVNGPCTSAQVGFRYARSTVEPDAVSAVPIPFAVRAGERLVIDTRPHEQTAYLTDAAGKVSDRTADLGADTSFLPIPAGGEVTLQLALAGDGTITADLEPLYWRAF